MDFKVIDVPAAPMDGVSAPIVAALLENLGKAIELSLEGRHSSSLRQTIRAALAKRKLLDAYRFRAQVAKDGKTITVWLEAKAETT